MEPEEPEALPTAPTSEVRAKQPRKKLFIVLTAIVILLLAGSTAYWLFARRDQPSAASISQENSVEPETIETLAIGPLELDTTKNYGDKYADGLLPVGDGKYKLDGAEKGNIYLCHTLSSNNGGAGSRGDWFVGTTQYDINKKLHVEGSMDWTPKLTISLSGDKRLITTNDLPNHPTGIFPIRATDPAYKVDKNPNAISEQSLSYALAAYPTYGDPQCMSGEAGVMLTGVALFNGFDAANRDAGAWEVQDSCSGHPQSAGEYHYHTLSSCITDISISTVIGYALDGFPLTGPKLGTANILTTDDLDECHGITSVINLDGKQVKTYHYVMTQDFPYSISCFHGQPIQPPGQHATSAGRRT